jgi:hypothetical protein
MRVLRAHQRRPALTVQDAHDAVKALALWLGTGKATAEDLVLEEKLKKATGVDVPSSHALSRTGRTPLKRGGLGICTLAFRLPGWPRSSARLKELAGKPDRPRHMCPGARTRVSHSCLTRANGR